MMRKARRASAPTVATYRDDPLYPRIERAMTSILAKVKVVAPVCITWKRSSTATSRASRVS